MEKLIYFLAGAVVILIIWLWRIIKSRGTRRKFEKVNHDLEILRGRIVQAENINLDLSELENKIEENYQELLSFVQQEIGEVNKNIRYSEERVNKLETEVENSFSKLEEIEEKIEEKEE